MSRCRCSVKNRNLVNLIPQPIRFGATQVVALPPQTGAVRVLKLTLTPVVGDALDLFLVCRIHESS